MADADIFDDDDEFADAVDSFEGPAYVEWSSFSDGEQECHINRMSIMIDKLAGDMIKILEDGDRVDSELRKLRSVAEAGWLERLAANWIARKHNQRIKQ